MPKLPLAKKKNPAKVASKRSKRGKVTAICGADIAGIKRAVLENRRHRAKSPRQDGDAPSARENYAVRRVEN